MGLPIGVAAGQDGADESWMRELLEVAACGLLVLDLHGRCVYLNGAAAALLGASAEAIEGTAPGSFFPEDATAFAQACERAQRTRQAASLDMRRPGGGWLSARVVRKGARLFVSLRDVTESHLQAEALRRAERRYDALQEASGLLVWRADPGGGYLESSPAWAAYTGRPERDPLGDDWIELIHPDDRERVAAHQQESIASNRPVELEYRLRRHDGVYRHFTMRVVRVRDEQGEVREFVGACEDIEDRHRKELERQELIRALERKRERFASILEALPVGVLLTEAPTGRVLQTNRAFDELTGGMAGSDVGLAAALSPIGRAVRAGMPVEGEEIRLLRADGNERCLRVSAVPLRDPAGAVVSGLGTAIDITDRKRMEEALRESERALRFCLETIPQQVWIARPDGAVEYFSPRFHEFTGLPPEYGNGWGWTSVIHPDDREACAATWRRSIEKGVDYEVEVRMRGADGRYRWFLARALPIRDERDAVVRWFGSNTDIHEHREIREALQASEARFQRIFDLGLLGMCTWRLDGQIVAANGEYLRIFGYDEADLLAGKLNWFAMTPPDQAALVEAIDRELRTNGSIRPIEKECLRADGSRAPIVLTAALDVPGGEQGTAFVFDASPRKQLEEFQHQLIGVVSHDLRSPLAAMLTTVGVLLRSKSLSPGERRALERIRGTAERMRRITRDLLDYTQARVGRGLSVDRIERDLGAICRGAVAEVRLLAPDREVRCTGEGTGSFPCDAGRLEQALSNLLVNAVKYGEGAIELRWSLGADEAVIEVENEGRPLDPVTLSQLFQPFRQGRRAEAPVTQSLGLGLYIVREIARAHGGTAEMEALEAGNRVRLRLPRGG